MARLADTLQKNHGVEVTNPRDIQEAEEKRRVTNLERYGSENVFCRESSIFDMVQASMDGRRPVLRGSDNPFAWTEVQEKIRRINLERYGAENPQQVPEIRERTRATFVDKYGAELLASPVIREKSETTNLLRYGVVNPANCPEVIERARQTNLERWGVEWTCQHPDIKDRQLKTQLETYGSHYFASEEGRAAIKATLQEKYGVGHPSQIEGFWVKVVETFVRRYRVTHPFLLEEFLEKRRNTCRVRYGVDNPLQDPEVYAKVFRKAQQTNLSRYGFPNAMQNPEIALKSLTATSRPGPNFPERLLQSMAPELLYTGDGGFWRWLPLLGHHKNPDFILPGLDPANPKKGVTKVVELFGDFWHSRMFTGKVNFEHESELVTAFAEIGIECLVVWESEVKKTPVETKERIKAFLGVTA
ncbi:MAG: hypothetical protein WCY09_09730 [Candidatus Omnitrophota bacterium]